MTTSQNVSLRTSCERVRLALPRGDQPAQIAVYERAPCVRAATEAFVSGYQTYVCKPDFRSALFFRDLKNNVRAIPLAFVFNKVELAVYHMPYDFLGRN